MNELNLNPCRKCRTTEFIKVFSFCGAVHKVECSKCQSTTDWCRTLDKAEAEWNRRADNDTNAD